MHEPDDAAEPFKAEYAEERFAELTQFLFARTDPLLLTRPHGSETDRALQALNDVVRALLGQARAFREWGNEPALAGTWDALTRIAAPWRQHPDFLPDWEWD
ncbi:hypothetical protein ABT224_19520 [Streptomyces sp. NPDC001584]|uniref:hypothetical protein n=1 Tax=Streptomyces sp. NPDC001584 TaxID=3154521 RepID=UPI0033307C86